MRGPWSPTGRGLAGEIWPIVNYRNIDTQNLKTVRDTKLGLNGGPIGKYPWLSIGAVGFDLGWPWGFKCQSTVKVIGDLKYVDYSTWSRFEVKTLLPMSFQSMTSENLCEPIPIMAPLGEILCEPRRLWRHGSRAPGFQSLKVWRNSDKVSKKLGMENLRFYTNILLCFGSDTSWRHKLLQKTVWSLEVIMWSVKLFYTGNLELPVHISLRPSFKNKHMLPNYIHRKLCGVLVRLNKVMYRYFCPQLTCLPFCHKTCGHPVLLSQVVDTLNSVCTTWPSLMLVPVSQLCWIHFGEY